MNIILLGAPGSGKGTIAKQFVDNYPNYSLITTGEILREEKNSGSRLGNIIKETIGKGFLVSDDVMNEIVENKLKTIVEPYLLDGYPRTIKQGEFLEKITGNSYVVIYIDVCDETITNRILERGKTSMRADDQSLEIIHRRLASFKSDTQPLFDFYNNKNMLLSINGENNMDSVFSDFRKIIDAFISQDNLLERCRIFNPND
jgi:adenylate kinase